MRIHIVIAIVGVYLELVFVMLYNNIYIYIYICSATFLYTKTMLQMCYIQNVCSIMSNSIFLTRRFCPKNTSH